VYFKDHIKTRKELNVYLGMKKKIAENLYINKFADIEKLNLYLNKIESNNLPYEEIKYKLIKELIDIMKNNCDKILEYLKDESKMELARKVILSNIHLLGDEFRNSRVIEILGIYNKSQNMIIY